MDNNNIQTGIQFFGSGNISGARQIFLEVLKREPNNEIAWLWLATCVDKVEQKRDCFRKVLAINPSNLNAQKALAELELQAISTTKSIPESGAVLKCPSCGSVMGKPDHTGLVQCSYCGTAITYHPPTEKVEQKNVERYLEICNSSLEGKNYDETLQYANKVLEIDPGNVNAWINKAIATFWFSTTAKNRFDEALGYLNKAEKRAPNDVWIIKTRRELTQNQANWLVRLGYEAMDRAHNEYMLILNRYSDGVLDTAINMADARTKKLECLTEAFNYFLEASSLTPSDVDVLGSFEVLFKSDKAFSQNALVNQKIQLLNLIRIKPDCEKKLPRLRQELKETQKILADLKKRNSIFDAFKLDSAEDKINKITKEITYCEQVIAYKIPT